MRSSLPHRLDPFFAIPNDRFLAARELTTLEFAQRIGEVSDEARVVAEERDEALRQLEFLQAEFESAQVRFPRNLWTSRGPGRCSRLLIDCCCPQENLEEERSAVRQLREELAAAAREASEAAGGAKVAELGASQAVARLEAEVKDLQAGLAAARAESSALGDSNRELAASVAKEQHDRAEAEVRERGVPPREREGEGEGGRERETERGRQGGREREREKEGGRGKEGERGRERRRRNAALLARAKHPGLELRTQLKGFVLRGVSGGASRISGDP